MKKRKHRDTLPAPKEDSSGEIVLGERRVKRNPKTIPQEVLDSILLTRDATADAIVDGDLMFVSTAAMHLYYAWQEANTIEIILKLVRETMNFVEKRRNILPNAPQSKAQPQNWLKPIR